MADKNILFICTHNSARSQMAEGLTRKLKGDRYNVKSGGTEPERVHPLAIKVMREIDIDISSHHAKNAMEFIDEDFDIIVTVCDKAKENCPFFPGGKKYIHRSFEDPSNFSGSQEEKLKKFRAVRDEIKSWIEKEL